MPSDLISKSKAEVEASREARGIFPWIDPTRGYPDDTLIDGVRKLEATRYVAVRGGGAHKGIGWMEAYHSDGLENIGGHDWRLFTADKAGALNGREWFWGMFVEGIGAFDVMVPAECVRDLTDAEVAHYSGRTMGMYGSHSNKLSYTFKLPALSRATPSPDMNEEGGGK